MNVLLLGSGGREHAIAWKLARSPLLERLFIAPGNAGTSAVGTNLPIPVNDFQAIKEACIMHEIGMVVVGPEDPLVKGIHDFFLADPVLKNIPVAGPLKMAAQLEGSKDFAKAFMQRHSIPTAAYRTFTAETLDEGCRFLETLNPPYVLKADGLAAGKGVVILPSLAEAKTELASMLLDSRFGEASRKVVIEEFLSGIELSVFVITDGDSYKILPEAKDYKKIGEGDTGPNTGGMGSVSPVPFASDAFMEKVETRVIKPTIDGLKREGIPYKGFIFFGLINVKGDPFVIEYNCRMGDPEAESVIPRIKNDLLRLFIATGEGTLEREEISVDPRFTATVILVSEGYPGDYVKGRVITGLDKVTGSLVFHSGTKQDASGNILTNGGRVIAVTSFGDTMHDALEKSYEGARLIHFEGAAFRRDIGFDL